MPGTTTPYILDAAMPIVARSSDQLPNPAVRESLADYPLALRAGAHGQCADTQAPVRTSRTEDLAFPTLWQG